MPHFRACSRFWRAFVALLAMTLLAVEPLRAVETEQITGSAHAFPVILDLDGNKLGNGEFTQEIEGGVLRVRISYHLNNERRIEEEAAFKQSPELAQKAWTWQELKGEERVRSYSVEFESGRATARKQEKNDLKNQSKQLEIRRSRLGWGERSGAADQKEIVQHA